MAFNLNCSRPSYFGLEAAEDLAAFVEAFDLSVSDPQADGMGESSFSTDGFLRGWNAGNRSARGLRSTFASGKRTAVVPTTVNTAVWRWNRAVPAYTERLCFLEMSCGRVPTVMRLQRDGGERVLTAVAWLHDMTAAIPTVDLVVARTEPRSTPRAIPMEQLVPLLAGVDHRPADHGFDEFGSTWTTGLDHWLVDPLPPEVQALLGEGGEPWSLRGLAPDQVLDAELLAAAG